MSYSDLLDRMMHQDTDAFLEMTDRYGWALYSAIRKVHPDKEDADKIYQETMQQFYRCLQNPDCEDPMEALLAAWADHIAYRKGLRMVISDAEQFVLSDEPPAVKARRLVQPQSPLPEKRKNWFVGIIGAVLLLIVLTASVWVIVGFLMETGVLPYLDLGYTWFCSLIEQWLLALNL